MHAAKACLLALGLLVVGCGSPQSLLMSNSSGGTTGGLSPASINGPTISSISPTSVPAGSADVVLNIEGTKFDADPAKKDHAGVYWTTDGGVSGTNLTILDANGTHITATIPATELTRSATAAVQVQIWHFADDMPKATSNTVEFRVTN